MPDNPISGKAGNITRLIQMLCYFDRNPELEVDFVSLGDWNDGWTKSEQESFYQKYPSIKLHILKRKYKEKIFKYLFLYKLPNLFKRNHIDMSSFILRKEFRKIARAKAYDKIMISYASFGYLIKGLNVKSDCIIDTHDFMTSQKKNTIKKVGKLFQDEIDILNKFDQIWTYSADEEYIFNQFINSKVLRVPISFPFQECYTDKKYSCDIIYVASDNEHNIAGITWFINEVLPHLGDRKVDIIGNIGKVIPDHPNLLKHGIVEHLEAYYTSAKIAICPMLSGTGIKIKVLEALSYFLPVVTNKRGVDGLINKSLNGCLVTENSFEFANNIISLLDDPALYAEIQYNAKKYFIENHSSHKEIEILDRVLLNRQ
ncbi:glycosyltransferase [Elizabethkingia argentiflava]|uniref:Glycosyltransferase n=1 Tax=Elizabethkingia argenteiflava TaxID=2681556 RepID=A0A845PYT9_9FLAO|nr:glycosyltransferase [Elizabethkingia argenteiflava]NAW51250.1 glycosyltransferase [Elizabethkingia argenteiflava]